MNPSSKLSKFGKKRVVGMFRKVNDATFKGNFDIYIFDIHKNKCRIVTRIQAATNKIFIRDTYSHAEYDK